MNLLVRLIAGALAFWAASSLIDGVVVNSGPWSYLWVALLFGLINIFIGSTVKPITLPAISLSFGLFSLVINAAMLMLTARWSDRLDVSNFWSAISGSIMILVITNLINNIYKLHNEL